jgi:hypothetical protein
MLINAPFGWTKLVAIGAAALIGSSGCSDETEASSSQGGAPGGGGSGGVGGSAGMGGFGGVGGVGGSGGTPCVQSLMPDLAIPTTLSAAGLYSDISTKTVADYMRPYEPNYELWTDGAAKTRWIYIPECGPQIDNTVDMNEPLSGDNHWDFPVGTRLFKEFAFGGLRVETRMIQRYDTGPDDWHFAAYEWDMGETEATHVPMGVTDVVDTGLTDINSATPALHDIPETQDCLRCHGGDNTGGRPSRVLSFSAIQLSHSIAGSETITSLSQEGLLTTEVAAPYLVPGNTTEADALGYLHANCGNCHNDAPGALTFIDMNLWVDVEAQTVDATATYLTSVCQLTQFFGGGGVTHRVLTGDTAASCVSYRMNERLSNAQMPPLGTDAQDVVGISLIENWINNLGVVCN